MRTQILALTLAAAVAGCGDGGQAPASASASANAPGTTSDHRDTAGLDAAYIQGAKEQVRAALRDPASAEFRDLVVRRVDGITAVCGEVNSTNGFGGKAGFKKFVSNGMSVTTIEGQIGAADMAMLWAKLCGT